MSNYPILPFLIVNYIQDTWLHSESLIPKPGYPYKLFFSGGSLTDTSYSIPATTDLQIPPFSSIHLLSFSLELNKEALYTQDCLSLQILEAEVVSDYNRPVNIIPVHKNPLVNEAIQAIKYKFLAEAIKDEVYSECSENSCLFINNLERLLSSQYSNKENQEGFLSLHTKKYRNTETPLREKFQTENYERRKSAKKKAENKETNSVIYEEETFHSQPADKPNESKITLKKKLDLEVFPDYALEILKRNFGLC